MLRVALVLTFPALSALSQLVTGPDRSWNSASSSPWVLSVQTPSAPQPFDFRLSSTIPTIDDPIIHPRSFTILDLVILNKGCKMVLDRSKRKFIADEVASMDIVEKSQCHQVKVEGIMDLK
ncbi:hypothetical protein PGTUg99_013402 [Puccinia graminis f. sp. tritici]|uniref:Uncharacterized protein n=1 Tax=Puccinia graminis f. sp. tritici TaxID=56615 RepID=A0A5B0MPA0_PUCGR|nr:hypothetical protein PGTUg99_013402 [Puccinia graminis f. sp. tritici]